MPDQGANRNTFYADASFVVGPTNTNGNGTYKLANENLHAVDGRPDACEEGLNDHDCVGPGCDRVRSASPRPTAPVRPCNAGQIATVHVRDGESVGLVWTLVIVGTLPARWS